MSMGMVIPVVSVSGGKDSTATALLAKDEHAERCVYVFADTGNEHELTLEYVHEYLPRVLGPVTVVKADFSRLMAGKRRFVAEKWAAAGVPQSRIDRAIEILTPTGNPFLDLCIWKGRFPSRKAQFCTQELKRRPLDAMMLNFLGKGADVESWRGIRRDESMNRSNALARERAAEGWTIVHPIVDWTAQQTVDFVLNRGISLNPLYSKGMGRVGCMPCINCSKNELAQIAHRFPQHIERIREWESLVCAASKRGFSSFFADAAMESPVEVPGWNQIEEVQQDGSISKKWVEPSSLVWERGRIDVRVEWAKTSRGGVQYDLIRSMEQPACSSLYGLCE
jgi:3'-phosphoadenosine 5'-phosphosulfate sulfotransferase (PAPS reductase)/FAD synthetase